MNPPEVQPPGGWVLKLAETGGIVKGKDFADFVAKINDQLSANHHPKLTGAEILERMKHAQYS